MTFQKISPRFVTPACALAFVLLLGLVPTAMDILADGASPFSAFADETSSDAPEDSLKPDTALLVMTDWHSHTANASVQGIADEARYLAQHYENVIVVLNGDSEDASSDKSTNTVSAWHHDATYVTPTMQLVSSLTSIGNVSVVMGIGNHELAMNSIGSSTGEQFSSWATTLKETYGNGMLHLVNTDLTYQDHSMAALFDGTIERSCTVAGILFVSGLDPRAVAEECAANKSDAAYSGYRISYAGKKGGLYADATAHDPLSATVSTLSDVFDSAPATAVMLLEHSGARDSTKGFSTFEDDLGLTSNTIVVCGHDHKKPYIDNDANGTCVLQPAKYGEGADIVYALDGQWVRTSRSTVKTTFGEFSNGDFQVKASAKG